MYSLWIKEVLLLSHNVRNVFTHRKIYVFSNNNKEYVLNLQCVDASGYIRLTAKEKSNVFPYLIGRGDIRY
jgi:hypothetical protein